MDKGDYNMSDTKAAILFWIILHGSIIGFILFVAYMDKRMTERVFGEPKPPKEKK